MSVISRVHVEQFQSIDVADIEFPQRETGGSLCTIVGPSSTGKSAILRALYMWAYNSSSPQVRAGKNTTSVLATICGHDVSITRGKSLSTYAIGDEKYTKAGTTTPDAVVAITGITKNFLGPNFSFQFDKPYMISETGSTVATELGRLTHANVLREAAREGARRALRSKQLADTRRNDATERQTTLDTEYADLPERKKALEAAIEALRVARTNIAQAERLQAGLDNLLAAQQTLAQLPVVPQVDVQERLNVSQEAITRAQVLSDAMAQLRQARDFQSSIPVVRAVDVSQTLASAAQDIQRASDISRHLADLRSASEALVIVPAVNVQEKFSQAETAMARIDKIRALLADVRAAITAVSEAQALAQSEEAKLNAVREESAALLADVAQHPCPTCGQLVPAGSK